MAHTVHNTFQDLDQDLDTRLKDLEETFKNLYRHRRCHTLATRPHDLHFFVTCEKCATLAGVRLGHAGSRHAVARLRRTAQQPCGSIYMGVHEPCSTGQVWCADLAAG